MSTKSRKQPEAGRVGACLQPASTLAHSPASKSKAAIRRCRAARKRAIEAYMREVEISGSKEPMGSPKIWAEVSGNKAYRDALPVPADYYSIRDFIACIAHGIAIGAVSVHQSGRLLYAAQVALATLHHAPKPPKTPRPRGVYPTPPLAKITRFSTTEKS